MKSFPIVPMNLNEENPPFLYLKAVTTIIPMPLVVSVTS